MSHGGDSGEVTEPNLTPLLDMVLQLVMFFMMVANFTMEEVNEDIKLPRAQSARPMGTTEMENILFLNIDAEGAVKVTGREQPLRNQTELDVFLSDKAKDFKQKNEKGELQALIIIRGHRDADYNKVYMVMQQCKNVGFNKWQVRAQTVAKS